MDKKTLAWYKANGKDYEYCDWCNELYHKDTDWKHFRDGRQQCEGCQCM